ncbi:MAG: alpha/beta hydrolase [Acetatifactor sp.]|nr:alpha/beta hydrolase [Acetatifactor sp.]
MWRKIRKILKWLLLLLAVSIVLGIIINAICKLLAKSKIQNAYGQEVSVKGKSMRVDIKGDPSNPVIILLSGLGCASPVLELEPLANALSQDYLVVTIEPFGYGLSDQTSEDRTIENVVSELHACAEALGYEEYYLMGHSLGGLYSLYWANQYPEEVKGFIGIDPSVPGMNDEQPFPISITAINKLSAYLTKAMNGVGLNRLLSAGHPEKAIYADTSYPYTEKELEVYRILSLDNAYNKTVMNEMKYLDANVEAVRGMRFPDQCAVLEFVSGSNCELLSIWEQLHRDVLPENGSGEVIRLEGSHYLHFEYLDQIVEHVVNWIV